MSDSSKLRFVYGVLLLIGAFICFGIVISFIFLFFLVTIPESAITPMFIISIVAFFGCIFFPPLSVYYFTASGIIRGKNIKIKEFKENINDPKYRDKIRNTPLP